MLLASAFVALVSGILAFLNAQTFGMFIVAMLLQGVFRALDSGPLEAWYVDTAQADDPEVQVEDGLSRAGSVLGLAHRCGRTHLRWADRLAPLRGGERPGAPPTGLRSACT